MTAAVTEQGLGDVQNTNSPDISDFDIMNLPSDFVPRAYTYFETLRAVSPIHRTVD